MTASVDRVELYKNKANKFCFRFVSGGNNENVNPNRSGYTTKRARIQAIDHIKDCLRNGIIVDRDKEKR